MPGGVREISLPGCYGQGVRRIKPQTDNVNKTDTAGNIKTQSLPCSASKTQLAAESMPASPTATEGPSHQAVRPAGYNFAYLGGCASSRQSLVICSQV